MRIIRSTAREVRVSEAMTARRKMIFSGRVSMSASGWKRDRMG
jgi:hypothetical protein